jgi:hypothetical protein
MELAWHGHLIAACLLPLYYIADATITLAQRIARHEPFWIAHRTHFYQRATDNGFTVARVVGEVFVLNVALAAFAIASAQTDSILLSLLAGLAGAMSVAVVLTRFARGRTA